ncbi:MAG: hypothetical protein JSW11_09290 [Candidatus Heimdallarchaeota archaeon]|nr:MAG: hypothetical protein JSW11_09290 [Candidatus Heimdallarchaeota archaeon]
MKVVYRNWEPKKNLEELQAKVYNENNPRSQPVTAQQIVERYEREKIDPKTVKYALDEEGNILAYIQARDYETVEETHLGYPWALTNCPQEVQDKLFDEMLDYIKKRELAKKYAIRMNASVDDKNIVDFFKGKGLVEKTRGYRYEIDVNEVNKSEYTGKEFSTRLATPGDVDLLVDLIKADGRYVGQFGSDKDIIDYFKDRVLKDGEEKGNKAVLVFKDDTLVMASAPLVFKAPGDDEERLILRFHAFRAENEQAYKPLIHDIAKVCVSNNYGTEKPLGVFIGDRDTEFSTILEEYNPNKVVTGIGFGLDE